MAPRFDAHLGQAAGLAASLLWTATSLFSPFVDIRPRRSMLIMTTSPPFAAFMYKERINRRAVIGALVAVGGTALLVGQPV